VSVAERREDLRAADIDRQFVADRLKGALDEGRLSLDEYDQRLQEAYVAKTYGDLDKLLSDLPGFAPVSASQVVPQQNMYPTDQIRHELGGRPAKKRLPKWVVGVWGAWFFVVGINVAIWFLVSLSAEDFVYFWPMWVGVPWGIVLVATTFRALASGDPDKELERQANERASRDAYRQDRHDRRRERRRGHDFH
jgi:hypothetical protein